MMLEEAGLDRYSGIKAIANINPVFCNDTNKILDAVATIIKTGHRRIPIVDKNNKLVGVITITDILDAFLRKQKLTDKLSTIMVRDIIVCNENDSLEKVLQKFKFSRKGGFPVVEKENKLVGIISERDIVKFFANRSFGKRVGDIMTPKPFITSSKVTILDCLKSVVNARYRRLPVVDDEKLVGIVTTIDILKYIYDHEFRFQDLATPLEAIIKRNVFTVNKNADISEAIREMKQRDIGGLLVVDGKKLEGIITERDILEEIT